MSITLITGVPGSGKTLYAIDKILRAYQGATSDKVLESGEVQKIPRVLYTNINGLLLDHEQIEGGGVWGNVTSSAVPGTGKSFRGEVLTDSLGGKTWFYEGNSEALRTWHKWAKPGSIICFDEFQKFWPPRPNGAPIPPDLQTLDTHRHMGVDFILVTQNCMNVDRHILGLVDRHLHVRRVANMAMAVVYEWDHASKSLLYKNALTKSPWRYDKSVFKLYKSAELHTKQKRKLPGLVWFILIGLLGSAYAFPTLKNRLTERISGKPPAIASSAVDQPKPGQKMEYSKDGIKYTVETTQATLPALAASAPASSVVAALAAPVVAGCIQHVRKCACFDVAGVAATVEPGYCEAHILGNALPGQKADLSNIPAPPDLERTSSDADVFAFMAKHR